MKEIMASESPTQDEGIGSFIYSPADASLPRLLALTRPLNELGASLLAIFAGQELTRDEIYERHNVNTPYIKKNYNAVLKQLEQDGDITVLSTASNRRKGTFGDKTTVVFPGKDRNGN